MTFTSFNPVQSHQINNAQIQPLTLKQGQVLHGTIKKLYPDQIAEVQVGSHRLIAKLETPLKAGDSHFFQVTNMNPQAELKVVSGPMAPSMTQAQQVQQLMDLMNLPKSNEMTQILSYFVKGQIPISKEQLMQAETWMKSLGEGNSKQEILNALQKMIEQKMPFTKDVLQAFIQGSKTNGMTDAIHSFTQTLMNDNSLSETVKTNLLQNLNQISKPFHTETSGLVLGKAIETLLSNSESIGGKIQFFNLLKEAKILPNNASVTNWQQQAFHQISPNQNLSPQNAGELMQLLKSMNAKNSSQIIDQVKNWVQNQSLLSSSQKTDLLTMITRFENAPINSQYIERFNQSFYENLLKAFSDNRVNHLFTIDQNGTTNKGHILSLLNNSEAVNSEQAKLMNLMKTALDSNQSIIQTSVQQAESQILSSIDSKAIQQAMKSILQTLGVSYEAGLNQNTIDISQLTNQIKPQILSLQQDGQASAPLKEAAEVLLSRMNGMQLLSGENGHQHQIVMQIPLQFFGKKMDATLQWNGRMKDDGKIDSNYARILFYLDMTSLQETVIDMQVQNRIVTINIYNDLEDLQILAEPLINSLKTQLFEKGYILSGVFIKSFERQFERKIVESTKDTKDERTSFNGVDIRI